MDELKSGDKVVYCGSGESEYGIVIYTWRNNHGDQDCHVAFYGRAFPDGDPGMVPYVLRYYAASLKRL